MSHYALLADAVLLLHFSFVVFVVIGLVLIVTGAAVRWQWIRNGWFRLAHLGAIGVVVAQAWLGQICPLTILEMWLRKQAGQTGYEGSFIQHWVGELLYYTAPPWVFLVLYTLFALLVVAAWWAFPPRLPWKHH
ncbi:MAG: DUF2784 domain-containing protein [Halieaceae bacterium]|nr:DUF2784 domain-containing protein [Halieaceae bacterium]